MFSKSPMIFATLLLTSILNFTLATPLNPRDSQDNRCGAAYGGNSCLSVGTNYNCCSQYGYCGDTAGHCGTGCQSGYGNCNSSPTSSSSIPTPTAPVTSRPELGSVPYGSDIYACSVPGTIALTFDDGPWQYTNQLLDILGNRGIKATFFVTGNNLDKGAIDDTSYPWATVIQRAYNEGHQIASHTWDHADLDTLSEADRRFQMIRNEQALMSILGRYPTYMRPPYIRCENPCRATMGALGYHVIIWDLDTDDYNNDSPSLIQNSKNLVTNAVAGSDPTDMSYMSIAHDIHYQTVVNLTNFQIDVGIANGYRHVRLGECLGDPQANWYRTVM